MMRKVWLGIILGGAALAYACSDAERPKPLGDPDAAKPTNDLDADIDAGPCAIAHEGCPCTMPGERAYCGTIYRYSAGRVDCEKGYATCQEDGGYGPCLGPVVFMPGD